MLRSPWIVAAFLCAGACFAGPGQIRELPCPPESTYRIPTNRLMVRLQHGVPPQWVAAEYGLTYVRTLKSDPDTHDFACAGVALARSIAIRMQRNGNIVRAYQSNLVRNDLNSFYPNDPLFFKDAPEVGERGQWHLQNSFNAARDVNVVPAWDRDLTGQGVIIAVLDDSMEPTHPDIAPNFNADNSYDFLDEDADPSPVAATDGHGCCTSAIAAARGGNGIGVASPAPFASIAGLRLGFGAATLDQDFYDATIYHSSGENRSIKIKSHSYSKGSAFVDDTLHDDAITISGQAGTIHVVSAGNARLSVARDSGKQMKMDNQWAIVVAAMSFQGQVASYSSFGANVFCTAPSSSAAMPSLTTADRLGQGFGYDGIPSFYDYTNQFGGTSASTPLVAGVLALLKQAQPIADTRFAKHMLVRTCRVIDPNTVDDPSDGGWRANAAGFKSNQNFGFGLIDANALTLLGASYDGVTKPASWDSGALQINQAIPDSNATGLVTTFPCPVNGNVETVEAFVDLAHTNRGDIEIYLTSPSGFRSRVCIASNADPVTTGMKWKFLANAFWGEKSTGDWKLAVVDNRRPANTGTLNSVRLRINLGLPTKLAAVSGKAMPTQWLSNQAVDGEIKLLYPGSSLVAVQTPATIQADGTFVANTPLPDGTFDVWIKASHWLARRVNGVTFSGGATGLNTSLQNGDCDGNNLVNSDDYLLLVEHFDALLGDAEYDSRADLDGDGYVGTDDYLILSDSFGDLGD